VVLAIGLGLTAGAPGARAADSPLPPLVTALETVADGAADVLTAAPIDPADAQKQPPAPVKGDNPRADITQASAEYAPGWIRLKVQVKNPTDPVKDPAWSDRSDAEWALDTNGDGKPEYTVEFASDKGELYGAVFDVNKPDDKSLCDADSASFTPQDGYTLVIDPKCIGNPKSLGYSVGMFFATDAKNDNSPMATDRAPDQGFKVVAAPGQPADAPAPASPTAGSPVAPNAAPSVARGPAGAPSRGPAAAPNRTAQATPGTTTPPAAAPAQSDPAAPPAPLARTGSATETRALFGLGIMLVGFGVVVMTRPARPSLAK
jgi:hypothetical protein